MLRRIIVGALAGALAVGPLTGVMLAFKRDALPPPATKAESDMDVKSTRADGDGAGTATTLPLGVSPAQAAQIGRRAAWGAGWGVLFGLVTGIARPTVVAGLILGLGLGKAAQDGWIPPLDTLPDSISSEQRGELPVMAAYAAFGLALGVAVDWFAGG